MKQIFSAAVFLLLISSCKKTESTPKPDCEVKNYGVLRVNFGSASIGHRVLISVGYYPYYKEFAAGIVSDTMLISAGTFSISISSGNSGSPAVDTETGTVTIVKCSETSKSVPF
ncbi:MAG: hypothetical protein U0T11_05335 [Chitinophagaceae bacterium]